jgi:hypothetical protein
MLALPEGPDQLNAYPLSEIRLCKCLPVFAAVGTKHIPGYLEGETGWFRWLRARAAVQIKSTSKVIIFDFGGCRLAS